MKGWPGVLVTTVREHFAGQSDIFAAGMAFFTAVSLAPLLVLAVAIAGTVFGPEAARAQLLHDVTAAMGPTAAATVDGFVGRAALEHDRWGRLATGIVVATWGAARIFAKLQDTLNALWGVRLRKDLPWRERLGVLVRKRLYAFLLVGLVGALLFASMLLQSVASGIAALATDLPFGAWPWRAIQGVIAVAIVTTLLILIYRVLPDVELHWRDVLPGALVAAVGATLGASAVGLYLGYAATSSLTGAAGGVLLLLLWMYFDGHVLLFGARFTRAWVARRRGALVPERHAELVP
jgi:membrane protein